MHMAELRNSMKARRASRNQDAKRSSGSEPGSGRDSGSSGRDSGSGRGSSSPPRRPASPPARPVPPSRNLGARQDSGLIRVRAARADSANAVERMSLTNDVLLDASLKVLFLEYAQQRHAGENVLFWLKLVDLKVRV
jgi:hypothetical protein